MAVKITNAMVNRPDSYLSQAYKSNGHVFTSGSVGLDYKTNKLPESVEEQTVLAIENLKEVLEKSGSSLDKVMKVLLFIVNREDAPVVNKIYAKYFPNKPARSCIMVQFPNPALKVELECIAECDPAPKL